jgi:4-hydroxy-4-methyl-2-oxoglutarate aldolase
MRTIAVIDPPNADIDDVRTLAGNGVAIVHEAVDRVGHLRLKLRPRWPNIRVGDAAVGVPDRPRTNLMHHVAVEVERHRRRGVLGIATRRASTDGLFGESLAIAYLHREARSAVSGCGLRYLAGLRGIAFAARRCVVSARDTAKPAAGVVNVSIVLGGQTVDPGGGVIGDGDGVAAVPRDDVTRGPIASVARAKKEIHDYAVF